MKSGLIHKIQEFIPLSSKDTEIIESLFHPEQYKANEVILREGTICSRLWFISQGLVRFTINADGEERTFIFRNEGCFISDIAGFLNDTPATKSIIALEPCALWAITRADLQQLFREVSHGERFGRLLIEGIFVAAVHHIESFYTETPKQRYIKLLKQNKDFIQRIPQYHIASFLGIKPQSLCRIKKKLLTTDL